MPVKELQNMRVSTVLTVETMKVGQLAFIAISHVLFFEQYITVKLTTPVYTKKKEGHVYAQITRNSKGFSHTDYTISFENVSKDYFLFFQSEKTLREMEVFKTHYLWFPVAYIDDVDEAILTPESIAARIQDKEQQLQWVTAHEDFEQAIRIRDEINTLKNKSNNSS